jgi:hypothetical protein
VVSEPQIVGYESLVPIGSGGLGDVYRATRSDDGATVAVKLLRDVTDSSQAWHRTRRELAALEALGGHANVIGPFELLELAGCPALVMEYAPGGSVADLARDSDDLLDPASAVFVGRQTAAALVAAHARGIVHRDVKPHNLLIDALGRVKLCDFGIAALTRHDDFRGRTNARSTRYASPEELDAGDDRGEPDEVGPPADVYSLGATLLHLSRATTRTLRARLAQWSPPPTDDPQQAALDVVLARCLDPDPIRRPTAQALLDALDGLALEAGPARVTALPVVTRPMFDDPSLLITLDDGTAPDRDATTVRPVACQPVADAPSLPLRPGPRRRLPKVVVAPPAVVVALVAIVVVTVVVVIVLVTVVVAGLVARSDTADPEPTSTSSTAPSSPIADGAPVTAARPAVGVALLDADWSAGEVGDCLAGGEPALRVVDCTEPHDLQRFATGTLDLSPVFDADVVDGAVAARCEAAFRRFAGTPVADSALAIADTRPSQESWNEGDRAYACYLGIDHAQLTTDARAPTG